MREGKHLIMTGKIVLGEHLGYPYIECDIENGIKIIERLSQKLGFESEDMRDAIRILNNYNEFYSYAKRKGKEFIVPSKRESDFIRGRVVIDKIKPLDTRNIMIIFERRIDKRLLEEIIKELEK
jgi:hypothetical protein